MLSSYITGSGEGCSFIAPFSVLWFMSYLTIDIQLQITETDGGRETRHTVGFKGHFTQKKTKKTQDYLRSISLNMRDISFYHNVYL